MFEEETTPKRGFVLVSAVRRNKESPDTFEIPPRKIRESRDVGDNVQLLFNPKDEADGLGERMWVCVTAVGSKNYEGTLRNSPAAGLKGILHWGDLVKFNASHIIGYEE